MKKLIPVILVLAFYTIASGQNGELPRISTTPDQHPEWRLKVAASVMERTVDGQSVPFLILLSQQADASDARRLSTKDEKASYVFHTLSKKATVTQEQLITFLQHENVDYGSLWIVNAIRTQGTRDLIQSIAQRTDVKRIISNPTSKFPEPVEWSDGDDGSRANVTWGIDTIHADEVWTMGYRGQGVVVGGEDTGYDWTHPALIKQYRGYDQIMDTVNHNYNWHDAIHAISSLSNDSINPCGLDALEPCDDFGHGTHTMGTMIGLDGDEAIGVAPEAEWCGCRNMESGNGSPFTYLECFQWFLAPTDLNDSFPDPAKSPHVINNSWSCPESEGCDSTNWSIMNQAIENLRLAGTVVVVSAGNSGGAGCSSVSDPAAIFEGSFSVGATAENDTIAGFSSRGPVAVDSSYRIKPNVSAPGVRVRSSKPGGVYGNSSGTSMAGPHVAGLVALIISANPSLAVKVDVIENIIEQTSVPKTTDQMCGDIPGSEVPNNTYGYGRIDALAAVKAALALIPTGTHEEKRNPGVRVYPNPVKDILIFDLQHPSGKVIVEIVDTQGRLIWKEQINTDTYASFQVDFSKRPAGIYFYRIMMKGTMEIGKVVKK